MAGKILTFPGISIDDLTGKSVPVVSGQLLKQPVEETDLLIKIKIFRKMDTWPQSLPGIRCWACMRYITGSPLAIPKSLDKNPMSGLYEFTMEGATCCFQCSERYIINKYSGIESIKYQILNRKLYTAMTGMETDNIDPSPCYQERIEFGGKYSDPEYQKKILPINGKPIKESAKRGGIWEIYDSSHNSEEYLVKHKRPVQINRNVTVSKPPVTANNDTEIFLASLKLSLT